MATCVHAQTNSAVSLPPAGYKLAWADEFNGNSLDTNKRDFRTDSKTWSTQLPQNVSVRDGKSILAVKKGLRVTSITLARPSSASSGSNTAITSRVSRCHRARASTRRFG